MATKTYVKAVDSSVPVDRSIAQIKKLVVEYGCSGFRTEEDYKTGTVTVTFILNPETGGHIPVQIPIRVERVYAAIYGTKPVRGTYKVSVTQAKAKRMEQAARTAWRNVYLQVEAALSAASIGALTVEEALMAHTLVVRDDGRTLRMADHLTETAGALAPGVRALLAPPSDR